MADATCAVEDCPRTDLEARGWCNKHYERWRRTGSIELGAVPRKPRKRKEPVPCKIEGCDRRARPSWNDWCRAHHDRWVRTGSTGPVGVAERRKYAPGDQCEADDCAERPRSRGLCSAHSWRANTYGDPNLRILRPRTGRRTCAKCLRSPEEVEFHSDRRTPDGLGAYCKPCSNAYGREYYQANRERILKQTNAYYRANRSVMLMKQREYRLRNIGRIRPYDRARSAGNPAKIARSAAFRASRQQDPEKQAAYLQYLKAWNTDNPDKVKANATRRRLRERGFDGRRVERVNRRTVWTCYRSLCGLCALPVPFDGMHLDHIKPVSKGGSHTYSNMQPSHPFCNQRKKDREVPPWAYATTADRRRAESLLRSRLRKCKNDSASATTQLSFLMSPSQLCS